MMVGREVVGEWMSTWASRLLREALGAYRIQHAGKMGGGRVAYLYGSDSTGLMKVG
jgi:hypothetical protein